MSHEVETLAYNLGNGVPWHGLGEALPEAAEFEEMYAASGLDWEVLKIPAYGFHNGTYIPSDLFLTMRESDNQILGQVTDEYRIVQNRVLFELAEAMLDVSDQPIKFESAGSLQFGKRVFVLAQIGEGIELLSADPLTLYLLISTRHDGKAAVHITPTCVRVICANTQNMAESGAKFQLRITHNGDITEKIPEAKRILGAYSETQRGFLDEMEELAQLSVDAEHIEGIGKFLYPQETKPAVKARMAIQSNFEEEFNAPIYGTAWNLLNAVTGWIDHGERWRGGNQGRYIYTLDGVGAEIKQHARQWLNDVVIGGLSQEDWPEPLNSQVTVDKQAGRVVTVGAPVTKAEAETGEDEDSSIDLEELFGNG